MSSLSVESQQKVRQEEPASVTSPESPRANQSTDTQLLATHLKEADPAMYEIIENASLQPRRPPLGGFRGAEELGRFWPRPKLTTWCQTGEEEAEALHQPHPFRELHITGSAGRSRQSHAEYDDHDDHDLWKRARRLTSPQTSTLRDIPEQDTMAVTSSSTLQRGYASKEHWRRSAWMTSNGVSMFNVRALRCPRPNGRGCVANTSSKLCPAHPPTYTSTPL